MHHLKERLTLMSQTLRTKLVAAGAAAALVGSAGLTAAQAATSSTSSSTKTKSAQTQGKKRGHGRLTTAQVRAIAAKLGVTSAQLQAALDANKPAKPTQDGTKKADGFATDLAAALGVDVAKVTPILEANRPAKPANATKPTGKPDQSALVSALASGLNLDTATVQAAIDKLHAAHDADRDAKRTELFAAIAKSLNLETSAVQAAFEAVLPARSTT